MLFQLVILMIPNKVRNVLQISIGPSIMLPNSCWRQIITITLGECEFVLEYLKKIQEVWAKKYDKNYQQNRLGWTNIEYISKHYTQVLCGLQWELGIARFHQIDCGDFKKGD